MPLITYTIEQAAKWDEVVQSFALHDVYYLSGYVKLFQIHGDGDPLLFYYESPSLRGINVVMKRDIADDIHFNGKIEKGIYFDFVTPYGYGGWLFEGAGDKECVFTAYEAWCRENNIVSEFVRFHPIVNNDVLIEESYEVVPLGQTVVMELSSPEVIWENLTSKNRNMIRKAQKSGVTIHHGQEPDIYMTFKNIYNLTMDSDNASPYYYFKDAFYQCIIEELSNESQVFWAELDGKIIAASVMIGTNGFMSYHLSGSLRSYRNLAPTNLLLYEAALWGCEQGFKTLHLGGGVGSKEDGLFKFKSAFNRNKKCQFSIGKKIYLHHIYDSLEEIRGEKLNTEYFPKYRG